MAFTGGQICIYNHVGDKTTEVFSPREPETEKPGWRVSIAIGKVFVRPESFSALL